MLIRIQIVCERGPHSNHQVRESKVGAVVSQLCDLLLGVAKYKWNLFGLSNRFCQIQRVSLTSEK
jgi:hypothetical protein